MAADRRALDQLDAISGGHPADDSVDIPRDQDGPARPNHFMMLGLGHFHLDSRVVVQAMSKRGREIRGHVLHHHDPRRGRGKSGEQLLQCLDTSGAHAHDDDSLARAGAGGISNLGQDHVGVMPRIGRAQGPRVAKGEAARSSGAPDAFQ